MLTSLWICLTKGSKKGSARKPAQPQSGSRLGMETLEDRMAPSGIGPQLASPVSQPPVLGQTFTNTVSAPSGTGTGTGAPAGTSGGQGGTAQPGPSYGVAFNFLVGSVAKTSDTMTAGNPYS